MSLGSPRCYAMGMAFVRGLVLWFCMQCDCSGGSELSLVGRLFLGVLLFSSPDHMISYTEAEGVYCIQDEAVFAS